MKSMKIFAALSLMFTMGCASADPVYIEHAERYTVVRVQARVVDAEPITRCIDPRQTQVQYQRQYQQPRERASTGQVLLGGIVGGVIGHQFGGGDGKRIATAVGALAGMSIASGGSDSDSSYYGGRSYDVRDTMQRDAYGRSLDVRDGYYGNNYNSYGNNAYYQTSGYNNDPYMNDGTLQCQQSGYSATIMYIHPYTQQMVTSKVQLAQIPQESMPSQYNGGQFTPFLISYPMKVALAPQEYR